MNATAHSGVVVSSLGGLSHIPSLDRKMQGNTMAHEMAHYFGLFHTSERDGASHDPVNDTAQCDTSHDSNDDGRVSAEECAGSGGDNMMFWVAPSDPNQFQVNLTDGQKFVLGRAALIQ